MRWIGDGPRWASVVVGLIVTGLAVGTTTHLVDLVTAGLRPYPWAPAWLNLYWTTLTVLDPVAAGLLLLRRRSGVVLTGAVVATDLAANWFATHRYLHGDLWSQPGLQRLLVFTVLVLIVAPALCRSMPDRGGPDRQARAKT